MIIVEGGRRLSGDVDVHGAKNSVLPIFAAAIISGKECVIQNCPDLKDVDSSIKILRHLGCTVQRNGDELYIDSAPMCRCDIPDNLMREMRSSVIFLGAILTRAGQADMYTPGGCELGPRPIDLHLDALRALGAEIDAVAGCIHCKAGNMRGCGINLTTPSVGATENSMLAAVCCEGITTITNAAREPEIEDLQNFLIMMGVNVKGAGTSVITVEGCPDRSKLKSVSHRVIGDRIVAVTFLACAASAGGNIKVCGVEPRYIRSAVNVLMEAGCEIQTEKDFVTINCDKRKKAPQPVSTEPYPGFPTDAQAPIMASLLKAEGTSVFIENIFENRFRHVDELIRMGADIKVEGRVAMISGVCSLHGAKVEATDLRGGAALIIAALAAEGESVISGTQHIYRGYDDIESSIKNLGGRIKRLEI